jgi:hypothetical protein
VILFGPIRSKKIFAGTSLGKKLLHGFLGVIRVMGFLHLKSGVRMWSWNRFGLSME